jgi:hypothetical protein
LLRRCRIIVALAVALYSTGTAAATGSMIDDKVGRSTLLSSQEQSCFVVGRICIGITPSDRSGLTAYRTVSVRSVPVPPPPPPVVGIVVLLLLLLLVPTMNRLCNTKRSVVGGIGRQRACSIN